MKKRGKYKQVNISLRPKDEHQYPEKRAGVSTSFLRTGQHCYYWKRSADGDCACARASACVGRNIRVPSDTISTDQSAPDRYILELVGLAETSARLSRPLPARRAHPAIVVVGGGWGQPWAVTNWWIKAKNGVGVCNNIERC